MVCSRLKNLPRLSSCPLAVLNMCGVLSPFVADALEPTTIDQVLVIAHFLNSAVRVIIASGWNANPKLAKVSGEREGDMGVYTYLVAAKRGPLSANTRCGPRFSLPVNHQMRRGWCSA